MSSSSFLRVFLLSMLLLVQQHIDASSVRGAGVEQLRNSPKKTSIMKNANQELSEQLRDYEEPTNPEPIAHNSVFVHWKLRKLLEREEQCERPRPAKSHPAPKQDKKLRKSMRRSAKYNRHHLPQMRRKHEHMQNLVTWVDKASRQQLFLFWMDATRELFLSGQVPVTATAQQIMPLGFDHSEKDQRRMFRELPIEQLRKVVTETAMHHPLGRLIAPDQYTPLRNSWNQGPFIAENLEMSPPERMQHLCGKFHEIPANEERSAPRRGELAYQIASMMILDVVDTPECEMHQAMDFLNLAAQHVTEAKFFRLGFLLSDPQVDPVRERELLKQTEYLAKTTQHPLGFVMLAARHSRGEIDCERALVYLMAAFVSIYPYVFEDSRGALERHERISHWHEKGLTLPEMYRTTSSRFESAHKFHEYADHLRNQAKEDPWAWLQLGDVYLNGAIEHGIPHNSEKAAQLYEVALDQGVAMGGVRLGYMILNNELPTIKDPAVAYHHFKRASDMGEAGGSLAVANFFHSGKHPLPEGIPRSEDEQLRLYIHAGERGLNEGYYQAALKYHFSSRFKNMRRAKHFYSLAISSGHAFATYELGRMMFYDVDEECVDALEFIKKSIRTDWTRYFAFDSEKAFRKWFKDPVGSLNSYRMASTLLWQKEAMMNAAYILEQGAQLERSTSSSSSSSVKVEGEHGARAANQPWDYSRSLMNFISSCITSMGLQHYKATDANLDALEAKKLYEMVANSPVDRNGEGLRKLGDCYALPWVGACEKDMEKAFEYYKEASAMGDSEATFNIGRFYEYGLGGADQNYTRALNQYDTFQDKEQDAGFYPAMLSKFWLLFRMKFFL